MHAYAIWVSEKSPEPWTKLRNGRLDDPQENSQTVKEKGHDNDIMYQFLALIPHHPTPLVDNQKQEEEIRDGLL